MGKKNFFKKLAIEVTCHYFLVGKKSVHRSYNKIGNESGFNKLTKSRVKTITEKISRLHNYT